jgi:hypothetical protein
VEGWGSLDGSAAEWVRLSVVRAVVRTWPRWALLLLLLMGVKDGARCSFVGVVGIATDIRL